MRHLLLAAALLLPTGSALAGPRDTVPQPTKFAGSRIDCMSSRVQHADGPQKPRANRLGDLPPGDLQLAVVREVDGCQEPVVVRQGYGSVARSDPSRR